MPLSLALTDDAHCFVCGKSNVHGLQMTWKTDGHHTESTFYPSKSHQGWAGLVHGGILAAILDEAITRLAWEVYGPALTAEVKIRYLHPSRIGTKLHVSADVGKTKGRLIPGKAQIRDDQGVVIAMAEGKAIKAKGAKT